VQKPRQPAARQGCCSGAKNRDSIGGMKDLIRTNNMVLISFIETLLTESGIAYFVADQHISATEGSIGLFPRRIMVEDDRLTEARTLLSDAGLGDELPPLKV
jgi:hypothetical protein